jgi:hypothetical protein
MVLPASTAAEGEAAEAEWLRQVRRWLYLGHKGVLVMIRDAQLAQLRPLVRMLESIDPTLTLTSHAPELLDCGEGALVLLIVQEQDLGWLNLNRPIFAQRSLRVVLWVEPELSGRLKFESPDLHDWISHFVPCPEGVPEFAVEGLRIGSSWWPGVAWRGPGLELALAQLKIEVTTLRPDAEFENLVATLSADRGANIRWAGIASLRALWRVRWALAEAGHHGFSVLDQPSVSTPGWFPVSSSQLDWAEAAMVLGTNKLAQAIGIEFEPEGIVPEMDESNSVEAEVGLLLRPGPNLRRLHGSPEIDNWRRQLVRAIQGAPEHAWSRVELAMFASLERDRRLWPTWTGEPSYRYTLEHILRTRTHGGELPDLPSSVMVLVEEPELNLHPSTLVTNTFGLADEAQVLTLGDAVGWDIPAVVRATAFLAAQQLDQPEALLAFLNAVLKAARAELGPNDHSLLPLIQIAAIATAIAGDPWMSRVQLKQASKSGKNLPVLGPDYAAILTLCGYPTHAARVLQPVVRGDSPETRLYIAVLLAAGQPEQARTELERILGGPHDPLDYLGDATNANERAREFLRVRLHDLAHHNPSWPFTAPDRHTSRDR